MDVYQLVTDKIVAGLETAVRWQKPWQSAFGNGKLARPVNAITRRPYSGINVPLLWASDGGSMEFATYKAWAGAGAQVRKGEKGNPIVFWKSYTTAPEGQGEEDGEEQHKRLVARLYYVFSSDQVDGWKGSPGEARKLSTVEAIAAADTFFANTKACVRHGGDKAYYSPALDFIGMPHREAFIGTDNRTASESYYGILAHETVHWSGHATRCAREFGKRFGDDAYAFEELVAELGAAFLCADLSITPETRPDHASYVANWLGVLRNDKRAVFTAASKAEQAARFLHSLQPQTEAAVAA